MGFSFDLGSVLGGAIQGAFGYAGSVTSANAVADINRSTMRFNAQEAQKARDFQERMSNSAFQRSRADLEAAGYNPLLALASPASSASGASASVSGLEVPPNGLSSLGTGLSKALKGIVGLELEQKKADIANTASSVERNQADADRLRAEAQAALENSGSNRLNAESSQWQLYDAQALGQAGFEVVGFGASGKGHIIQSIRINKLTGETYDALTGKKIQIIRSVPANSAQQTSSSTVNNYHYHDNRSWLDKINDSFRHPSIMSAGH